MTAAQMKLAIARSDMLRNFYTAERRAGATPLEANERMHFFAKRMDETSPFEAELEAVRQIMEQS